ncbi:hypothetical protein D1007_13346 [Hordeum vulgare]|nr:hypothetical protein D1007_13346 [Hordeum vulgare]
MPGPIVHNETTAADQGSFVAILANLTCRAFAMGEPPEYVVYQEHTSDAIRHFWATLTAREAIVQLGHLSPRVNCRPFYYYPSHESYGRPLQVANRDHETDTILLHLVRYLRAQEALYDQVTLDLLAAREELARLDLMRREVEPDARNPVVLFGRPIEPLRSVPAPKPNHTPISPEELRRILGISYNGTLATAPLNGHHCYPSLIAPPPSPSNCDVVVPVNPTSTRPAHLDVNEVD